MPGKPMHSIGPVDFRMVSGFAVGVLFCLILIQRGAHRRLPLLAAYAVAVLVMDAVRHAVRWRFGFNSSAYFNIYWAAQVVLIALRGGLVVQLCRYILGPYRGVWKFCRDILFVLAIILVGVACVESRHQISQILFFALTLEQGLEFAIGGALLSALLFCRFYGIPVEKFAGKIAAGLCIYSLVQVANNIYFTSSMVTVLPMQEVRYFAFAMMQMVWISALWKPIPAKQSAPALLGAEQYDAVSFEVIGRLRELNARLEELL
jgi:hypothetical protein